MSQYPEDFFDQTSEEAATLEQARLEAQKVQADKGSLGDPKDNPVYTMKEPKIVRPADVQNANEVLARNTAAEALSYPTGETEGATATITAINEKFPETAPADPVE